MVTSILSVVVAGIVVAGIVDIVVGDIVDIAEEDTVVEDIGRSPRILVAGCYKSVFLNLET